MFLSFQGGRVPAISQENDDFRLRLAVLKSLLTARIETVSRVTEGVCTWTREQGTPHVLSVLSCNECVPQGPNGATFSTKAVDLHRFGLFGRCGAR